MKAIIAGNVKERDKVFSLAWNKSKSIPEVSERLGMSQLTVRTHASYMRKMGRADLKCLCCHCPGKK